MVFPFHEQVFPVRDEQPFTLNGSPLTNVTAVPFVLTVPVATFPRESLVVNMSPPAPDWALATTSKWPAVTGFGNGFERVRGSPSAFCQGKHCTIVQPFPMFVLGAV